MAAKKIEVWAKRLPEVGDPIRLRAMNIEAINKEIAALNKRASYERRMLGKAVRKLWTPEEIKEAKEMAK